MTANGNAVKRIYSYSVWQLFMLVTFVAGSIAFLRSEGLGHRISRVTTIEFTREGSILCSRYDARNAMFRYKSYMANASRTVSVLSIGNGETQWIIDESALKGMSNSQFRKTQYDFQLIGDDSIALRKLGSFDYVQYNLRRKSGVTNGLTAIAIAVSSDQRFILSALPDSVSLISNPDGNIQWTLPTRFAANSAPIAITKDCRFCILTTESKLEFYHMATGNLFKSMDIERKPDAIMSASDLSVITLDAESGVRLISSDGSQQLVEPSPNLSCLAINADCTTIATNLDGDYGVSVYNLVSGSRISFPTDFEVTCVKFSPDDKYIAIGDAMGQIALFDLHGMKTKWIVPAVGQYKIPYLFPVLVQVASLFGLYYLRRSKSVQMP